MANDHDFKIKWGKSQWRKTDSGSSAYSADNNYVD